MSAFGVSMDPEKVEAVMSWERPKSVFEIRSFLGLAGYYMQFIEELSRLAALMTRLTRKEVKFEWNDLCEKAFQELKRRFTNVLKSGPDRPVQPSIDHKIGLIQCKKPFLTEPTVEPVNWRSNR